MASFLYWPINVFILAVFCPQFVTNCTCILNHPQSDYCSADFVFLIQPKEVIDSTTDYNRTYKARLFRVFKDRLGLFKSHYVTLYTNQLDGMCGLYLELGVKYIITGKVNANGLPDLSLCDTHIKWKEVTKKQKKGFHQLYQHGCECRIESIFSTTKSNSSNTCIFDHFYREGECQLEYSVCMKHNIDKCEWLHSRDFKQCLRRKESLI